MLRAVYDAALSVGGGHLRRARFEIEQRDEHGVQAARQDQSRVLVITTTIPMT